MDKLNIYIYINILILIYNDGKKEWRWGSLNEWINASIDLFNELGWIKNRFLIISK